MCYGEIIAEKEEKAKGCLQQRLLGVLAHTCERYFRYGCISGGEYDVLFATVAVSLASAKVTNVDTTLAEAQDIVAQLETINFNIFGNPFEDTPWEKVSAIKKQFTRDTIEPLYAAYLDSGSRGNFPEAESYFTYILSQWKDDSISG